MENKIYRQRTVYDNLTILSKEFRKANAKLISFVLSMLMSYKYAMCKTIWQYTDLQTVTKVMKKSLFRIQQKGLRVNTDSVMERRKQILSDVIEIYLSI